ncbi:hypothetical protein HWV62_17116 [Athelia sp. TMB]|nr:hypothetical protein HWV62_17116 [Athelia sp. TMB]
MGGDSDIPTSNGRMTPEQAASRVSVSAVPHSRFMLWNLPLHSARTLRPCLRQPLSRWPNYSSAHNGLCPTKRFLTNSPSPIPSFREQVARNIEIGSFSEQVQRPSIRNQIFVSGLCSWVGAAGAEAVCWQFFLAGSGLAFSYAAVKTNIDTEKWQKSITAMSTIWSTRQPTTDEMRRTQNFALGARLQGWVNDLKDATEGWPIAIRNLIFVSYVSTANTYLSASEGRRLCWKICLLNAGVWVLWKVPRLSAAMRRSWTHHPLSGLSYTMLTAVFSHQSFMHLLFNCMALASFGAATSNFLSREQAHAESGLQESTTTWHFLAFFVSAGLFSSLVSHVAATRILYPRMVAQLTKASAATTVASAFSKPALAAAARPLHDILPSLGASGAIYAAVSLTALGFPDSEVSLIFLPGVLIPSQAAVGGLVCLDIVGVLRGWRMFDHYAHLGGALFGAVYWAWGPRFWDWMRVRLARPEVAKGVQSGEKET